MHRPRLPRPHLRLPHLHRHPLQSWLYHHRHRQLRHHRPRRCHYPSRLTLHPQRPLASPLTIAHIRRHQHQTATEHHHHRRRTTNTIRQLHCSPNHYLRPRCLLPCHSLLAIPIHLVQGDRRQPTLNVAGPHIRTSTQISTVVRSPRQGTPRPNTCQPKLHQQATTRPPLRAPEHRRR